MKQFHSKILGMSKLPKTLRDNKENADLCKCRPICKSRRREWKGEIQETSAELLLERRPVPECFRRWPTKVYPNSPCPLFAAARRVTAVDRDAPRPNVVRICQAPVDDAVDTPYLKLAQIAKDLGALDAVKACCAFCSCSGCCICVRRDYEPAETRDTTRRRDMQQFDARVRRDSQTMRIMYDKI